MTGLDNAIATLLASRTELLMSAIRAPAGVAGGGVTGASVGQTTTPQTGGPYAVGAPASGSAPAASAQTALSSVARTLDVISRFGGTAPALTGDAPLWPTPPRPASAFAALTTGLFDTAFASNAAAVAAARAAAQNLPPLPASVMAAALARTVDESGLFYESHLAQWIAGERSAASLGNEPQARVDARSMNLPLELPDNAATHGDSAFDVPDDFHASANASANARAVALPQNPQQAAALAASVRDAPPSALSNSQSGNATAASAGGAGTQSARANEHESALQASISAGIHPATLNVVRQQLDMLANQQFRWQGEAWPGTRLEWKIAREPRDSRTTADAAADERAWRTRITLSLPALGTVDAELMLTGEKLVARIKAGDSGARRLAADGEAFARQLEAAGIALASLSVRSMDGTTDLALSAEKPAKKKPMRSPLEHLFRQPNGEGSEA